MKLKFIAAACVAVCSTGAFAAATPIACSKTNLANLVKTCSPEITFYVGGASAQSGAMTAILESSTGGGIFDTTKTRGKVTLDNTSVVAGNGNTVGYIGSASADLGVTYAGKTVLVIYNKANGSFAGVNQLLTGKGGAFEEVTLKTASAKELLKGIPQTGCGTPTTESADAAVSTLGVVACTTAAAFSTAWGTDAQKKMHMALSDVRANEASPGIVKSWKPASFPSQTTGMQGFGVIVNPNLYTALITKEIAAGRMAPSCATSETITGVTNALGVNTITAACVPNLSRADYASLITGKITTAEKLTGIAGDTKVIKLARRTASSGTQAASNIYFANQQGYNAKLTAPGADSYADVLGAGSYDAAGVETAVPANATMVVTEGTATGDVITTVSNEVWKAAVAPATDPTLPNYALGVVSIENTYSNTPTSGKLKGALFVKLENVSPIHKADGTIDAKTRAGMLNGYPFAFQMQAMKSATLGEPYATIYTKIVTALTDPSRDLAGIAYIGSGDATKNTAYTRFTDEAVTGGNYLPLRKN